jgi:serine/threonine protein phosphatase PrpC
LLTDDASGTATFRQVTRDHRPSDPLEAERLEACVARGEAYIVKHKSSHGLRLFPGGLALSRDIGDVAFCRAAIATPDVFVVKIAPPPCDTMYSNSNDDLDDDDASTSSSSTDAPPPPCTTCRFVLASDGVWDVMSNETVGQLAARYPNGNIGEGSEEISPSLAATSIMKECLPHKGYLDDVTILVVDVIVSGSSR